MLDEPLDRNSMKDLLRDLSLGHRVAEDESDGLAEYFVETEQWRGLWVGETDVILGSKGSGKSAMYSTLVNRQNSLFDRNILVALAENPKGQPAFKGIAGDAPKNEDEFNNLWKLYFLAVIVNTLEEYDIENTAAKNLKRVLTDARLREGNLSLRQHLKDALDYIKQLARPSEIEPGISFDSSGVITGVSNKIRFSEPSVNERAKGYLSVESLYDLADQALQEAGFSIWILLDRLDVAFSGTPELEILALRSLFRVYSDLNPYKSFRLKIFLRSDIWSSLAAPGYREATHVTREKTIVWDRTTLMQLVVRRLVQSDLVSNHYGSTPEKILQDSSKQERFFDNLYPWQIDAGPNKPWTFDWCLSRTQDGTQRTAPRELIHLLSVARENQLRRLEVGDPLPGEGRLFDRAPIKGALNEVSQTRLEKTIYAEHPSEKPWIEAMRGVKTNHNIASLCAIWSLPSSEGTAIANRLVEIGFFEKRGSLPNPISYWVPFLYRSALNLVQGSADGVLDDTLPIEEL